MRIGFFAIRTLRAVIRAGPGTVLSTYFSGGGQATMRLQQRWRRTKFKVDYIPRGLLGNHVANGATRRGGPEGQCLIGGFIPPARSPKVIIRDIGPSIALRASWESTLELREQRLILATGTG